MMHRGYILIQDDDIKARSWRRAAKSLGVDIKTTPGSAIYWPINLMRYTLRHGRPKALVFRYLNDYPQLWKTVLRLLSEMLCIGLCAILRTRIVWICHNVDRESSINYPAISYLRRYLLKRRAAAILVTDKHLVEFAQKQFPDKKRHIGYISFGPYIRKSDAVETREFTQLVKRSSAQWRSEVGAQTGRVMVGLCAGSPSWKMEHYARIPELINTAEAVGVHLRMIVAGPIEEHLKKQAPDALEFIRKDDRVRFRIGYVPIAEHEIAPFIDFYWRAYKDFSVPMSVYTAASVQVPSLVLNIGFLPHMIRNYKLGAVLEPDMANIREALAEIDEWAGDNVKEFLRLNTWSQGAAKLVAACGFHGVDACGEIASADSVPAICDAYP